MSDPDVGTRKPGKRAPGLKTWVAIGLALATGCLWQLHQLATRGLQAQLLVSEPDAVLRQPRLVKAAMTEAIPLYASHCASCHGEHLQGNAALGAPALADDHWLYGSGSVFDIERTVLYGIRSGNPKAHNLTDMPPLGLTGVLNPGQVRELVEYVLMLSQRPHDGQAALAGRGLYFAQGNCADCHGADAKGNSDYGAPDLTANVWNNGGDPAALYQSIYSGRHRVMPGWRGTLTLEQIRSLSLYIYVASHPHAG